MKTINYAFATYAEALAFSSDCPGIETPLVLVRQPEWLAHQR